MDFFGQGIPLGRWFKIQVLIHWTFVLFAAFEIFEGGGDPGTSALVMGLLFATVLVHEFGHALSCRAVGGEASRIILWPLGGIAFVQPPMNARAWLITTVCGPLVNAVLWPACYFISEILITHRYGALAWPVIRDSINADAGGIRIYSDLSIPIQVSLLMWQINRLLLLFNLIPAYPMDGGRILQELLWFGVGYARSLMIAGMIGTVAGIAFIVIGLGIQSIYIPGINFTLGSQGHEQIILAIIGLLCCQQSFTIYKQSQQIAAWRKE